MPRIAPRPRTDALARLSDRSLAALILAAHRQLLGSSMLRENTPISSPQPPPQQTKVVERHALDRAKHAEQCEQERNWKQSRHVKPIFATRAVDNARLEEGNVGRVGSVPAGERAGVEKNLQGKILNR